MNSGGRVKFKKDGFVRILELNGLTSGIVYSVLDEKSDRKGCVQLKECNSDKIIRIHNRRILPLEIEGKLVVVESGDRCWVVCPCGDVGSIEASDSYTCPKCTLVSQCHWLGDRTMAEVTAAVKKTPKSKVEPKVRKTKDVVAVAKIDFATMKDTPNCEVWTKKTVKFDHEKINVQAHVLLFTGESPRKLCFNSYDGALGKKADPLPLENFLANKPVKGQKKEIPWFVVADLDKARDALKKSGYDCK